MKKYTITLWICFMAIVCHAQKFGKVGIVEVSMEEHPIYPEAKAAFIYKNCSSSYDFRGQNIRLISKYHYRIKIYDDSALDYAEFTIHLSKSKKDKEKIKGLKGATFNAVDGKVEKSKLDKDDIFKSEGNEHYDFVTFALPNARKGSIVDVVYTIQSPFIYAFPTHFFQGNIPVDNSVYKIEVPQYFSVTPIATGSFPLEKEEEVKNISLVEHTIATFKAKNVPALKHDDYVLNIDDYRSSIKYELESADFPGRKIQRFSSDWQTIGDNLLKYEVFGDKLKASVGAAQDFVEEARALELDERIQKVYEYVKEHVAWNGEMDKYAESPKKVIKNKSGSSGDLNLLLINLLRRAEVDCDPVVTKIRSQGLLNQFYPSLTELNYVFARATGSKGDIFLDASAKNLPVNALPLRALNISGLLVKKKESHMVDIPNTNTSSYTNLTTFNVDLENEKLLGEGTTKLAKYSASKYRNSLEEDLEEEDNQDLENVNDEEEDDEEDFEEGEEEEEEEIDTEEDLINNVEVTGLEDLNKPIKIKFTNEVYSAIQAIGPEVFIDAFVDTDLNSNLFEEEKRDFPAFFNSKPNLFYVKTINVPDGYRIKSLPEGILMKMEDGSGLFSYSATDTGSSISVKIKLQLIQSIYVPATYEVLKNFFEHVSSKQKEKIILEKIM